MTIDNQPEIIQPGKFGTDAREAYFIAIQQNTLRARTKHPHLADSPHHFMSLLMEEVGEAAKALNDGDHEAFERELYDVGTLVQRWKEGDGEHE